MDQEPQVNTALVELKGGLIVRADALILALDLERHGHALSAREGQLTVSHATSLAEADREQIRTHRLCLLAIAAYNAPQ
jgi:hypothetical protein